MKKLFVLLTLTLLVSGGLFAQIKAGDTAWVAAKSVTLKSSTWFFAGARGTLKLADQVTVLQIKGKYAEVRSAANSSTSGWTASSNFSARQIVASGTTASASEIALAGKGFSKEVEAVYKGEKDLDRAYASVDKAEDVPVPQNQSADELPKFQAELLNFMESGALFIGEEE